MWDAGRRQWYAPQSLREQDFVRWMPTPTAAFTDWLPYYFHDHCIETDHILKEESNWFEGA